MMAILTAVGTILNLVFAIILSQGGEVDVSLLASFVSRKLCYGSVIM